MSALAAIVFSVGPWTADQVTGYILANRKPGFIPVPGTSDTIPGVVNFGATIAAAKSGH